MTFDVFVQGFAGGDAAPLDAEVVLDALGPLVDDGNVYADDPERGCMFASVTDEVAAAIARIIVQADAVAMWPAEGLTAAVGRPEKARDLPKDFERVVIVRNSDDVRRAIGTG